MEKDLANFFVKLFAFIVILSCISLASAEIRINEVELNPAGTDSGNEWLELYSSENVSLEGWKISSSNGRNMTLNVSFLGYYSFITSYNLLTNENNVLTLIDEAGNTIFSTSGLKDTVNDERSWQYCGNEWVFRISTRNKENNCTEEQIGNQTEQVEEEQQTDAEEESNGTRKEQEENANDGGNKDIKENNIEKEKKTIILNEAEDIKSSDNVLYESKASRIKEYALLGFSVLCIEVIILLLIDRRKFKRNMEE